MDLNDFYAKTSYWSQIVTARKYRRLCAQLCGITTIFIVMATLTGLTIFDHQHNNIIHEYVARQDDLAILSATYYEKSKSYPDNTVVLLLNAHQVFHLKHSQLSILSHNSTDRVHSGFRIHQVVGELPFYCKWVPFLAIGQVADGMTSLELASGQKGMEIATRRPFPGQLDVVSCFTPLFLNERWQLLMLSAEIYSHYGAHLHFYVRSMISDLFEMIKRYPRSTVQPWPAVRLGKERAAGSSFDPNVELEFRNQAAAMTDCLLHYKEAATYIVFPDLDDVIIPRMGQTYLEEFQKVFSTYPLAAAVAYNMSQTSLRSAVSPGHFSPTSVIQSIKFKGETRWGKLVVRPEYLYSVWIHKSYGIREEYQQVSLPISENSILHLRFWKFSRGRPAHTDVTAVYEPMADEQEGAESNMGRDLIDPKDMQQIENSFQKRATDNADLYSNLPTVSIYYPLIERCYNKMFYNGQQHATCKGPELCDLPSFPGIRCMNVASKFETFSDYENIFVHRLVSAEFVESTTGCTL